MNIRKKSYSWKVSVKNPLKDYGIPLLPAGILPLSDSWFPWIFKSRILDTVFHGSLQEFFDAASGDYDFTQLDDFGDTLNQNIHDWFSDENNLILWHELQKELIFEERKEMNTMMKENVFTGCTIVATGKLAHFTRDEINSKIIELGAKAGSSVTKKTDYLI